MRVISVKKIRDFEEEHTEAGTALDGWYRIIKRNTFNNFSELKATFNSVDKVETFHVFNVGGNKFRVITVIHFNRQTVYIRHILTHPEYDRGDWKND